MHPFGNIDVFPVGVNPPKPKKDIIRVSGGDTIVIKDFVTDWDGRPITPENSITSFCLRDQKFSDEAVWTGGWFDGITLDNGKAGHVVVKIPDIVSWSLRRGSFVYSLLVSDKLLNNRRTHMRGSLLVEYEATSPHSSIPYKDGADSRQAYQHVSNNPRYVTGIGMDGHRYFPESSGMVYLPVAGGGVQHSCVLPLGDKRYKLFLKLVDGSPVSYWVETKEGASPAVAELNGVMYELKLVEIDGVITSYWDKLIK